MKVLKFLMMLLVVVAGLKETCTAQSESSDFSSFKKRVYPFLLRHCSDCHSSNSTYPSGPAHSDKNPELAFLNFKNFVNVQNPEYSKALQQVKNNHFCSEHGICANSNLILKQFPILFLDWARSLNDKEKNDGENTVALGELKVNSKLPATFVLQLPQAQGEIALTVTPERDGYYSISAPRLKGIFGNYIISGIDIKTSSTQANLGFEKLDFKYTFFTASKTSVPVANFKTRIAVGSDMKINLALKGYHFLAEPQLRCERGLSYFRKNVFPYISLPPLNQEIAKAFGKDEISSEWFAEAQNMVQACQFYEQFTNSNLSVNIEDRQQKTTEEIVLFNRIKLAIDEQASTFELLNYGAAIYATPLVDRGLEYLLNNLDRTYALYQLETICGISKNRTQLWCWHSKTVFGSDGRPLSNPSISSDLRPKLVWSSATDTIAELFSDGADKYLFRTVSGEIWSSKNHFLNQENGARMISETIFDDRAEKRRLQSSVALEILRPLKLKIDFPVAFLLSKNLRNDIPGTKLATFISESGKYITYSFENTLIEEYSPNDARKNRFKSYIRKTFVTGSFNEKLSKSIGFFSTQDTTSEYGNRDLVCALLSDETKIACLHIYTETIDESQRLIVSRGYSRERIVIKKKSLPFKAGNGKILKLFPLFSNFSEKFGFCLLRSTGAIDCSERYEIESTEKKFTKPTVLFTQSHLNLYRLNFKIDEASLDQIAISPIGACVVNKLSNSELGCVTMANEDAPNYDYTKNNNARTSFQIHQTSTSKINGTQNSPIENFISRPIFSRYKFDSNQMVEKLMFLNPLNGSLLYVKMKGSVDAMFNDLLLQKSNLILFSPPAQLMAIPMRGDSHWSRFDLLRANPSTQVSVDSICFSAQENSNAAAECINIQNDFRVPGIFKWQTLRQGNDENSTSNTPKTFIQELE
jgi:hypothetical protein